MCPSDTPEDALGRVHPKVLDIFREAFAFLLRERRLQEALTHANRMVQVFKAFESESSMCKTLFAVTILQLSMGDIVQVRRFLN